MAQYGEGFLPSIHGNRLYWRSVAPDGPSRAALGVVHGYGDHSGRYVRTLEDFAARGIATLAFDCHGHGMSDGRRADCLHWDDYVNDCQAFWNRLREVSGQLPAFLFGHSHGALIVTHLATSKPVDLAGIVLSAPFFKLAFEPSKLKLFAAKILKKILPGLPLYSGLRSEQLSRDEAWQTATRDDLLSLRVATPRWFFQVLKVQERLFERARTITQPLLVVAGTDDSIASMPAARTCFDMFASSDKTWKDYLGFRHEVLNEIGREIVIDDISRWISERC